MSDTNPNPNQTEAEVEAAAAAQAAAEAEAAAAAAAAAAEAEAKKPGKTIPARVLQDCEHGAANDLVELPEAQAKAAQSAGLVDTNKAAVAYARTLPQNQRA